jgi:hypothetical protein
VRLDTDLRVYGEVRGLSETVWQRLALECPFAGVSFTAGVLAIEHEGRWVDGAPFLEAVVAALGPGGEGHVDLIDNEAWTITRCALAPGKLDCRTFGLDEVLENTKSEGNI